MENKYNVGDVVIGIKIFDDETSKLICNEVFEFFEKYSDIKDKDYADSDTISQSDNGRIDAIYLGGRLCDIVKKRLYYINE